MYILDGPRFLPGQNLEFQNFHLGDGGFEANLVRSEIEGVAGGGFRGGVVLLDDSVLKTGVPRPTKEFLRSLNTAPAFEPAHNEVRARADHVSSRLLGLIVPNVTDSGIQVPKSFGYADIGDGVGFAQHIERVSGRIATFEPNSSDNRRIQDAREEIWEVLGQQFGFEHAAQVHPKNPFGKPNIWVGGNEQLIWLDWLPAFPLKGRAWPNPFAYDFHRDAQATFARPVPFDRIDVTRAREALADYSGRFDEHELLQAKRLLEVYEKLLVDAESNNPTSGPEFARSRYLTVASLGLSATAEVIGSAVPDIVKSSEARKQLFSKFRKIEELRAMILRKSFLRGMSQANIHGIVSDQEMDHTLDFLSAKDARFYTSMQVGYFAISRMSDLVATPFYAAAASSGSDAPNRLALTALLHQALPNIVRGFGTYALGKKTGRDLKSMAIHSTVPALGTYTAVPYQITREYGDKANKIRHYNRRSLVAKISKLSPSGGWGSDAEERLWNKIDRIKLRKFIISEKLGSLARSTGI